MKYMVALIICLLFLFMPKLVIGASQYDIDSAKLSLTADFSSESSSRCIVGFTNADSFSRYDDVKNESSMGLSLDNEGYYVGSINVYWQMDNSNTVSVSLNVDTPFFVSSMSEDKSYGAIVSYVPCNEKVMDASNPTELKVYYNNSGVIYSKSNKTIWDTGYTTLTFSVPEASVIDNYFTLNDGETYATFSLVVSAT